MAKSLVGEWNLLGATLRPSFAIVYEIEQRLGRDIATLAADITRREARIILAMAMGRVWQRPFMYVLSRTHLRIAARNLLLTGLGLSSNEALAARPADIAALAKPDWDDLLRIATGMLGYSPTQFWAMTAIEFQRAYEGFCQLNGIEAASNTVPATSQEVAEMLKRFPDSHFQAVF